MSTTSEPTAPQSASYDRRLDLLARRLENDPRAFRELFISDGMAAVAWEFQQPELGVEFVGRLWEMLLRGDDSSADASARSLVERMRTVCGRSVIMRRSVR